MITYKFQNISIVALGLEKCFTLFIFYNKIKTQMGQNVSLFYAQKNP